MCGIAGYFNICRDAAAHPDALELMSNILHYRGPDSAGTFRTSFAGLGFRRLSIIDLDTGDQPITSEDEELVLICNGEIFNHKELRRELIARGHRFRTGSDTEVLLHLYEESGPAMMGRINGQFAFAILDLRNRQLFLARDPVGVAPLHYTTVSGTFIFASEIKAILQYPGVTREVNPTGLDQVLTFPGLVSPATLFKGIHRLKPGHYLLVDDKGVREHEYWDLDYPVTTEPRPAPLSEADCLRQLGETFARSIQMRLQADVPVGLYLSGGLDSSLIAAFTHRLQPSLERQAFAISFDDARADEADYQQVMADHVGCRLHSSRFDWQRTADMVRTMIFHAECPVKETYNTCSMQLSRAARDAGIKVILSGEGADELFAGYVGYRFDRAATNGHAAAAAEIDPAERTLRQQLWGDGNVGYELNYHQHRQHRRLLYSQALQGEFANFDCLRQPLVRRDRVVGRHPVHQRSYLDFKLRMADHLLMDHGDHMALANSVEVRYPFLDLDLIERIKHFSPDLMLRGYTEKYLLRRLGQRLLPRAILHREKFGWYAPGSPQMLQNGVEWVCDMLSPQLIRRQGFFDERAVEKLRRRYSEPGFKLNQPFETDWLMVVATFGLFLEIFRMQAS